MINSPVYFSRHLIQHMQEAKYDRQPSHKIAFHTRLDITFIEITHKLRGKNPSRVNELKAPIFLEATSNTDTL